MNLPKCCGSRMTVSLETWHYYEVECTKCGDKVIIKKDDVEKPQMIDD